MDGGEAVRQKMQKTIPVVLAVLFLVGCSQKSKWTAFVYPDRENISYAANVHSFIEGTYKTFPECQEAAIAKTRTNFAKTGVVGDYECGYKCEFKEGYGGLFMCKETRK